MQHINPIDGPGSTSPVSSKEEKKTTEALFDHISQWLQVSGQTDALTEILAHLEIIQRGTFKEKSSASLLPDDNVANAVREKVTAARQTIPRLMDLLEKKDFSSLLALLKPFATGTSLPAATDASFSKLLTPFLNSQISDNNTLGELALASLSLDKQTLVTLGRGDPSNPLASSAKTLLQKPPLEETKVPEVELSKAITQKQNDLRAAQTKLQDSLSPYAVYQSYLKEQEGAHASTVSYQNLSAVMEKEVAFLNQSLAFLEQKVGKKPEVVALAKQLQQIQVPPDHDQNDLLKETGTEFFNLYQKYRDEGIVSKQDHAQFLEQTSAALSKIVTACQEQRQNNLNGMASHQRNFDTYESLESQLSFVSSTLSNTTELTPDKLKELASTLSDMNVHYRALQPSEQKQIDAFFKELSLLKTTDGSPLSTVTAESTFQGLVKEFESLKEQNATTASLNTWLTSKLAQLKETKMQNPYMTAFLDTLESKVQTASPPAAEKKVVLETSTDQAVSKATSLAAYAAASQDKEKTLLEGKKKATTAVDAVAVEGSKALTDVANKKVLSSGEKGDLDFSGADIVKVLDAVTAMFNQNMIDTATDMSNSNQVRSAILSLISSMTSFPNASTNYGLAKLLQTATASAGTYNQSPAFVQSMAQTEINQIGTDGAALSALKAPVSNLIALLQKIQAQMGPKFPTQLQNALSDMQSLQTSIPAMLANLTSLYSTLDTIKIAAQSQNMANPNAKTTTLPASVVKNLNTQENLLVQGQPASTGASPAAAILGLVQMHDVTNNDSQNLATLSQTQQMNVQLQFTEMSQLWQAITNLISKLHEIFDPLISSLRGT